jgi:hypothetical protein
MRKLIALEEFAQFVLACYAMHWLKIPFNYLFIVYFFVPDVFAVGYLVNPSVGAMMYNFSHSKFIAIALILLGLFSNEYIILAGLFAYAHSSFDRMLGYGLKYMDASDHTHLGLIGKRKHLNPPDML